ncbi:hypothetical protein [Bradyrhizobium sp. Rc2d]|uniref:hypothetical protein n=1 Tax=Bradyrhizobium sp. Rc2d TaxID=1855321 RepID=UPI0015A24874
MFFDRIQEALLRGGSSSGREFLNRLREDWNIDQRLDRTPMEIALQWKESTLLVTYCPNVVGEIDIFRKTADRTVRL